MNDITRKVIGERINEALATLNVKQKELAEQLNVKDNVVSYWCSGIRTPNTEQIIQIAKTLNVSTDYLLGVTNTMSTNVDLKAVSKYTGFDDKSIETLLHWKDTIDNSDSVNDRTITITKILNRMFQQRSFYQFLAQINNYILHIDISTEISKKLSKDAKKNKTPDFKKYCEDTISQLYKEARFCYHEALDYSRTLVQDIAEAENLNNEICVNKMFVTLTTNEFDENDCSDGDE